MSPPFMSSPPTRPSRLGYWIAAVLVVVAVACGIVAGVSFSSLSHQVDSFQRVQVPGQGTVTFSQPGGYLLYFEGPGFSSLGSTGAVQVSLQSQTSGQRVSITELHGKSETYTFGGHSGQAVGSFMITTPGKYVLSAGPPTNPAPTDVAVGSGLGGSLVGAIVGLIVGIFALVGAVILGIITGVRRGSARRRLMQPAMPYGRPVMPPPYGQYPGTGAQPGPAAPQPYGQYPGAGAPPGPAGTAALRAVPSAERSPAAAAVRNTLMGNRAITAVLGAIALAP